MSKCICKGNWRNLVKEYEPLIGKEFHGETEQHEFTFVGIMHGDDDYYYVLWSKEYTVFSSCVGRLEDHYELVEPEKEKITDPCPDCGKQLIGGDNWSGVKCPDKKCGYWFCF